jgi:DNA-binding NtrC family response regulator
MPVNIPDETAAADPFALSADQVNQCRLQLAQYRKMLAQNGGRTRLHTLVVEDQAFSRGLLYEILHHACSVSVAVNAREGWKLYFEEAPDVVFLDIGLPEISGHALADKIKELDPQSYIVMVTGSQDVADVQIARNNRVDGFIVKPFNKKQIDDCVDRYHVMHKAKTKAGRA